MVESSFLQRLVSLLTKLSLFLVFPLWSSECRMLWRIYTISHSYYKVSSFLSHWVRASLLRKPDSAWNLHGDVSYGDNDRGEWPISRRKKWYVCILTLIKSYVETEKKHISSLQHETKNKADIGQRCALARMWMIWVSDWLGTWFVDWLILNLDLWSSRGESHDSRWIRPFFAVLTKAWPTDRQTDRPTDRPTDTASYRHAWAHQKKKQNIVMRLKRKKPQWNVITGMIGSGSLRSTL